VKRGKLYLGTSGWNYKHWIGPFYPATIKQSGELAYYAMQFRTVELNNSFYKLPKRELFERWKKETPKGFLFSVKASRYITHMKKLRDPKQSIDLIIHNAQGLGTKLGPILFQLPPRWNLNLERFALFLKSLPKGLRYTFEFRNETWNVPGVFELLKKFNCAYCIYELNGHLTPLKVTADFVYVRLHGPGGKYEGIYKKRTLKKWVDLLDKWRKTGKDVFLYFDNDQHGYAARNARELQAMTNKILS
jgi:uncharacterized protein YecE (DUF72 family)